MSRTRVHRQLPLPLDSSKEQEEKKPDIVMAHPRPHREYFSYLDVTSPNHDPEKGSPSNPFLRRNTSRRKQN
ncbi:MAG: hypothetical protein WCI52_01680 [bacterium]